MANFRELRKNPNHPFWAFIEQLDNNSKTAEASSRTENNNNNNNNNNERSKDAPMVSTSRNATPPTSQLDQGPWEYVNEKDADAAAPSAAAAAAAGQQDTMGETSDSTDSEDDVLKDDPMHVDETPEQRKTRREARKERHERRERKEKREARQLKTEQRELRREAREHNKAQREAKQSERAERAKARAAAPQAEYQPEDEEQQQQQQQQQETDNTRRETRGARHAHWAPHGSHGRHEHGHGGPHWGFEGRGGFGGPRGGFGMRGHFGGGPRGFHHHHPHGPPPAHPHGPGRAPGGPPPFDLPAIAGWIQNMFIDPRQAPRGATSTETQDFTPAVDVFSTVEAYIVYVSLPGAKKSDVAVNWAAESSTLVVSGVITSDTHDMVRITSERQLGAFERRIVLGTDDEYVKIWEEGITAKMEDGVLKIEVPKAQKEEVEFTPKRVEIQ